MKKIKLSKKLLTATLALGLSAGLSSCTKDSGKIFGLKEVGNSAEHGSDHQCGEGKCGEGKCGGDHKCGEGKCGGEDHKCGEGKCGGEHEGHH